ncbi:MAG: thioredoxin [Anaerolineae bacterium]
MSKPIAVTDETFDAHVLQSDLPVLIDFWAVWCGPCRAIAPIVEQIADEYDGQLKVTKLDVDQNPGTAIRYGVRSIPTLILFKNGQEVERQVGTTSKEHLLSKIRPHL